jgi:gamma-glutamyltranspeptidase/glutathione hydrolase
MPPPSSGGVALLQILGIVERRFAGSGASRPDDPAYLHLLAEAMKHAFADRSGWLADPDFAPVPVERLLEPAYLDRLAASFDPQHTRHFSRYGSPIMVIEDAGTSHVSVLDGSGMAVACTETINLEFGSLVETSGFALNNEMDDFTTRPGRPNAFGLVQSPRNLPEPGKRPLSSMAPTILLEEGRPVLVAGASGGPRIISATAQAILSCVLLGLPPDEALAAPRVHHQWLPDVLYFESGRADRGLVGQMTRRGHAIGLLASIGAAQMIQVDGDVVLAACDPRRGGRPAGP